MSGGPTAINPTTIRYATGKLRHDSAIPLEAFPAADKDAVKTKAKKRDRPGGVAEVLIR